MVRIPAIKAIPIRAICKGERMRLSASTNRRQRTFYLATLVLVFLAGAILFMAPDSQARRTTTGQTALATTRTIPNEFDERGMHGVPKGSNLRSPQSDQLKALGSLENRLGAKLKVQYNGLTATPRHLFVDGGYLTQPSNADPESIARSFLTQWSSIFRFSTDDLDNLRLKSRATLPDTGTTILLFEQEVNSLPVYHGEVLVNVSRNGRIIDVGGESFPQLSVNNSFAITPAQAITNAAAGVNVNGFSPQSMGATQVLATYGTLPPQSNPASKFSGGGVFTDDIVVERIIFPTGDGGRFAYKLSLTTPQYYGIIWESIIDAETGAVLRRISLTSFLGPGGGGIGVGRRATFRPDIQDIVEAYNASGTAQGKVFDGAPTTLSGPQGFGGSTRTGTAPNFAYTSPGYSLDTADPTTGAGHFRYSVIQARNEHPLMFPTAPTPFTQAQLSAKLSQVQRGFPDAGSPTAASPFGWFYLPTDNGGTEVTSGNSDHAATRALGYTMAAEAKARNNTTTPANSPSGNGDQPFAADSTSLVTTATLADGRSFGSVFQSRYSEGNNCFVADDRANDDETTQGVKGYSANRQFTASYFDFVNSYYYGGVDATSAGPGGTPCAPLGPCTVTYPATSNPDVCPVDMTLFYYNNVIHDYWYSLGFTEALWNFQQDNFGTRTGEYINQFRVRRRIDWSQ